MASAKSNEDKEEDTELDRSPTPPMAISPLVSAMEGVNINAFTLPEGDGDISLSEGSSEVSSSPPAAAAAAAAPLVSTVAAAAAPQSRAMQVLTGRRRVVPRRSSGAVPTGAVPRRSSVDGITSQLSLTGLNRSLLTETRPRIDRADLGPMSRHFRRFLQEQEARAAAPTRRRSSRNNKKKRRRTKKGGKKTKRKKRRKYRTKKNKSKRRRKTRRK